MNWKILLDNYLTTPPSNDFDDWCDEVVDEFTDSFYNENEDWIIDYDGVCNHWFNVLYKKDKNPKEAAKIIEKTFKILIKKT